MLVAAQPDVLAAAQLARDLQGADTLAAVRGAVLAGLPELLRCDTSPPDGRPSRLIFRPARCDLTGAELALVELLRPHLLAATRRAEATERLNAAHLTPRERAVLDLVVAGAPNGNIAHRLQMRPRTVEKHLEHAYAKLGVCSRTAAAAALRAITH